MGFCHCLRLLEVGVCGCACLDIFGPPNRVFDIYWQYGSGLWIHMMILGLYFYR